MCDAIVSLIFGRAFSRKILPGVEEPTFCVVIVQGSNDCSRKAQLSRCIDGVPGVRITLIRTVSHI